MVLSSAGFVLSMGTFKPVNFEYQGRCQGTVVKLIDSEWLVYTLGDLNIPGSRQGPYIRTIPTDDVREIVEEENLLFWRNADVNVTVEGRTFSGRAFVLGHRKEGDRILLDCYIVVRNNVPVVFEATEIPV